jgi:hypothetical protein
MRNGRIIICALLTLAGFCTAFAAYTPLRSDVAGEAPLIQVLRNNLSEVQLEIRLPGLELTEGALDGKRWDRVEIPGGGYELDQGSPETPHFTRLILIPATAAVHAEFEALESTIIPNILLMPAQGKDPVDLKITDHVQYNEVVYARNTLYPSQRVMIGEPAIIRGQRVVALRTNPVQYNPVTRELVVTTKFRVTVSFDGQDLRNVPIRSLLLSRSWANMIRAGSFNGDDLEYDAEAVGAYMIIAENDAGLQGYLTPLVDWKKRKGHSVTVQTFPTTSVPSNTTVKSWIQTAYDTWPIPLEFVMLVGDVDGGTSYQLPGWSVTAPPYGGDITDYAYAQLEGNDILPDVALGRLPAANATEAQTMINKILYYEKIPYTDNSAWYHQGVLIAESPGSGFSTIQTNRYIKTRMILNQYTRIDTLWYNMSGSVNTTLSPAINNGVIYANYRGEGTMGNFYTSSIDALTNGRKLPFVVTITCGTGGFEGDSFMEHFVVSGAPATPRAAVGCIGTATLGTHTRFNNVMDMGVFAGIFDVGATESGNALNYGKLQLWLTYGIHDFSAADNFCRWNALAGDPGLEMFTKAIQFMTCSVPDQVTFGVNSLTLNVNETGVGPLEEAIVCLYKAGELQSVGTTNANGQVTLPLTVSAAGNVKVTITKQNFFPLVDSLEVVSAAVAVGYQSHTVDDDNLGGTVGDNDNVLNPGETVDLPLTFMNYGTSTTATGITTTAAESDPFTTLSSATQSFPNMTPGATGNSGGSLRLVLTSDCPDGYTVPLAFNTTSGQGSWLGGLALPVVSYLMTLLSAQTSGSDTLLSPGETANLILAVKNFGHKTATALTATITSLDPLVTVNDNSASFGTINIGAPGNCSANPFNLTAAANAPPGHPAKLRVVFSANNAAQTETLTVALGTKHSYDPQGPDEYGYYCFDNTDANYAQTPTYNWVEIDPTFGGSGTMIPISDVSDSDDSSFVVTLPFTFGYYGQTATQVTVCSNGWLSTVANISFNDFRNHPIPCPIGPYAMIAPFWDDLITWSGGHVYSWHDVVNHRFIIEWSRMKSLAWPQPQQIFEVILLDPAYYSTPTGDGEIIFQYHTIDHIQGISDDNPWSTIGIESPNQLVGIETMYWGSYHDPAAAPVQTGRAMKFTTAITFQPPGGTLDVTLAPVNPPIVIPASGGSFSYNVSVTNNGSSPASFDGWIMQYTPGGTWQGPMLGPVSLILPAGVTVTRLRTQNVPGSAAPGVYTYRGYVGIYSTVKWDSSSFTYTKSVTGDGSFVGDWDNWGESFAPYETVTTSQDGLPAQYSLEQNRPNPFNPTTSINYQLAALSHVNIRVYDTAGRLVTSLVDSWQEAGTHQVTFDGSKLSSGLYFLRMQAGEFNSVRKMMLVK